MRGYYPVWVMRLARLFCCEHRFKREMGAAHIGMIRAAAVPEQGMCQWCMMLRHDARVGR